MNALSITLYGELSPWPCKDDLAALLRAAGFCISVGFFSIIIKDLNRHYLGEFEGDMGVPQFDADADSAEPMQSQARAISDALTQAEIRHRLEVWDHLDNMSGYLHYNWPS